MDHSTLDTRDEQSRPESGAAVADRQGADPDRALWGQFAEASSAEAFCRSWLALQCRLIGGVRGGLVLLGPPDHGPFTPAAVWPHVKRSMKHLTAAAERALAERRGLLLKGKPDGSGRTPQRDRVDVAYPVEVAGQLHGVVVLDVAPRPEAELQAVLRQLHWGAAWLQVLFHKENAAKDAVTKEHMQTVLDLVATILEHERFYASTMAFVNALATRLKFDRVSLGFLRRGHVRIRAVSHSAQFGKETNLIRAIGSAMDEAIDQQAVIVYPTEPGSAPQITRAHDELVRQHGLGSICSIPLNDGGSALGALTLERSADASFEPATIELCEAVGAVAGPMLEVKRRDDRWLLTKAVETCRVQLGHLIGPRHVAMKLTVLAVAGVIAFFAIARGNYRVTADTVIEASIQRAVVAPFETYIMDALVRAGDLVREGQLLASLDDRELRLERLKWLSQREQLVKQYHQALANSDAAQARIITAQIDQTRAQLALLDDQLFRTQILAPFDGVVVSGDLSQALGAPVERGQVLFEVAPLNAYRIILQVDERDIPEVAVGKQGQLVLSAFSGESLPFTVKKITPVSTAREGRNYFRVEARLQSVPDRLRPGMEGIGKIEIDRRRLIWIWTHQMIDWLRLKLWSWLP